MAVKRDLSPDTIPHRFARRHFLRSTGAGLLHGAQVFQSKRAKAGHPVDVFSLGVASGDPTHNSVVIWTRLAPQPLDGGGLGHIKIPVRWAIARDPELHDVIQQGVTMATPYDGHSVQVVVSQLPSNSWLYYRFRALDQYSRLGRTRTFPHPNATPHQMRFAVASCQNYTTGQFSAYRDMIHQNLDFVIHVDDYIYDHRPSHPTLWSHRSHHQAKIYSIGDYRNRHALYRLDPDLQNAHAHLPFIVTKNHYSADRTLTGDNHQADVRYRNAAKVLQESLPMALGSPPQGTSRFFDMNRRFVFGRLADIHVLSAHQLRAAPRTNKGRHSSTLTFGYPNELQLNQDLYHSRARWNIFAQENQLTPWKLGRRAQEKLANNPSIPSRAKTTLLQQFAAIDTVINTNAWQRDTFARQRMLRTLETLCPNNPVFVSGGPHAAWAASIRKDLNDPSSKVLAVEFVCTSISSTFGGVDPRPLDFAFRACLDDNPHIEFFNGLFRGYCICDVSRERLRTTFRGLGSLTDLQNPAADAMVPKADSVAETDAIVEIPHGFNRLRSSPPLRTRIARIPVRW